MLRKGMKGEPMYFTVGLIFMITLWGLIEQKLLMTTKYYFTSEKLGRDFAGTSFLVLSDLHNHSFGKKNQRLIAKIDQLSPDYILVAGDMINKRQSSIPSNAFSLLENLSKRYPIYYALGNHEQYILQNDMDFYKEEDTHSLDASANLESSEKPFGEKGHYAWGEYLKQLQHAGVHFLDNQSCFIKKKNSKLYISGLTIDGEYYGKGKTQDMSKDYINSQLGKCKTDTFQLLIAHNPLYFKEYTNWGADLTISGHLHGGLVRLGKIGLLSPQVRFFPKYDAGRFHDHGKDMIVSRGLGSHSIMFRLFNPPELIYIQLKK
jgi:predicted MPP superfamily phosphohydrolase